MHTQIDDPWQISTKRRIKRLCTIAIIILVAEFFSGINRSVDNTEFYSEVYLSETDYAQHIGRLIGRNLPLIVSLILFIVAFSLRIKLKRYSTPNYKKQARMNDPEQRKKYLE